MTCKICTSMTKAFAHFLQTATTSNVTSRSTLCSAVRAAVYFSEQLVNTMLSCKLFLISDKKQNAGLDKAVRVLNQLNNVLGEILANVTKFWECGVPEDSFLMMFLKISQKIISVKSAISNSGMSSSVARLCAFLVHTFPTTSTPLRVALQQLVTAHTFSCSAAVQIVQILSDKYENTQFVVELMKEFVSGDVDGSRDTSGIKNLAAFITRVSEGLPKMM